MKARAAVAAMIMAPACCVFAQATPSAPASLPLQKVSQRELCITNGAVSTQAGGRLAIDTPSSRAVLRTVTAQTAEIRFRYVGPSAEVKPLASGELRRQIGLKLRAQDTCNLLYAMWHIEPDARIAVSIKRNPGKHLNEECHANGYRNIKARKSIELPRIRPGESHRLRAELRGTNLTLFADGAVAWEGTVDGAMEIDGPVGLRSDNARFEFDYYAAAELADTRSKASDEKFSRCAVGAGD